MEEIFRIIYGEAGVENVLTRLSDVEGGRKACKGEGETGDGAERKVEFLCVEARAAIFAYCKQAREMA